MPFGADSQAQNMKPFVAWVYDFWDRFDVWMSHAARKTLERWTTKGVSRAHTTQSWLVYTNTLLFANECARSRNANVHKWYWDRVYLLGYLPKQNDSVLDWVSTFREWKAILAVFFAFHDSWLSSTSSRTQSNTYDTHTHITCNYIVCGERGTQHTLLLTSTYIFHMGKTITANMFNTLHTHMRDIAISTTNDCRWNCRKFEIECFVARNRNSICETISTDSNSDVMSSFLMRTIFSHFLQCGVFRTSRERDRDECRGREREREKETT